VVCLNRASIVEDSKKNMEWIFSQCWGDHGPREIVFLFFNPPSNS
jgi:hypothetical protein